MKVAIEGFGELSDQVRESALASIEHADNRIEGWRAEADGVAVDLAGGGEDPELAERIRGLVRETIDSYRFFKAEILDEDAGEPISCASPYPSLVKSGQVSIISPGTPVYQGEFARRLAVLDDRIRIQAWARGAIEQIYPSTAPTASLAANGYLTSYPQHALFVAALHRDIASLTRAAQFAKSGGDAPALMSSLVGEAEEVLAPTVCYRCFESLRCAPGLARPLIAGRTFTGVANCHRREDKALEELSRLQTFRMREIVFFGEPAFVADHRGWWMSETARLLRSWRARFRFIAASDPFFQPSAAQKRAYQSMRRLKFECQMHIPHADQWLAVASFNIHEATLTDAYGLAEAPAAGAAALHSGCVGFGYDRLLFAILSQFGEHSRLWPGPLAQFLDESDERTASAWSL